MTGFAFGLGRWVQDEKVNPSWIYDAELICKKNGGLKYLELDTYLHDVECNDGAVFMDAVKTEEND